MHLPMQTCSSYRGLFVITLRAKRAHRKPNIHACAPMSVNANYRKKKSQANTNAVMAGTNAWASYLAFGVPAIKSQKRELDEESVKERFG